MALEALSEADEAVLAKALPTVPLLAAHRRSALAVTRLGGLTNIVFKVSAPGDDGGVPFCLRCPGAGTETYIDRAAEKHNALAADRAGVGPKVLHFGDNGVMLMPLLSGETMSPQAFQSKPGATMRAGAALKKLHGSGETFQPTFELFEQIDKYLGELGSDAKLPDGYHETMAMAEDVRAALNARPLPSAPCHCDPVCENFVDDADAGVMRILDFEYAGMNDPMWDLGDLSVEAGLDDAAEEAFLAAYFGDVPPSEAELGRVACYKAMSDVLWTLWGLLQHKNGNPAEDFWAYSIGRFERCRALMATPAFARHVAAVRAGP